MKTIGDTSPQLPDVTAENNVRGMSMYTICNILKFNVLSKNNSSRLC